MTAHADVSTDENGCTMWAPRIFLRSVAIVLPPVLAHTSPSRYHAVRPSTVFWYGTLSLIAAGTRALHRSAGSVQWASQSMILTSMRASRSGRSVSVAMLCPFSVVDGPSAATDLRLLFAENSGQVLDRVRCMKSFALLG